MSGVGRGGVGGLGTGVDGRGRGLPGAASLNGSWVVGKSWTCVS